MNWASLLHLLNVIWFTLRKSVVLFYTVPFIIVIWLTSDLVSISLRTAAHCHQSGLTPLLWFADPVQPIYIGKGIKNLIKPLKGNISLEKAYYETGMETVL